jgi:hypothetical protein
LPPDALSPVSPGPDADGPFDVPFDQYQRYRITAVLAAAARQSHAGGEAPRLLDVGGHFRDMYGGNRRPIREFVTGWDTITVDLPDSDLPGYVRARGDWLPFADGTFDLVSSVDVLEHVPPAARPRLLSELLRVSRRAVVLAAPFRSPLVEEAERAMADFVERVCGYVQGQLEEHRQQGLPEIEATTIPFVASGWHTAVFPYGNLWRWLFMMLDKHAVAALPGGRPVHQQMDEHYNRRLFALDRELPCYRHFIVASRRADDEVLSCAADRFGATASPATDVTDVAAGPHPFAFDLAALHAVNQEIQARGEAMRRDTQLAELYEQHAEAQRCLQAKDAYIAKLEAMLRTVESSWSHRLGRAVRKVWPRGENW